ncbi:hypothetical protein [Allosalinactinospora lopnorensis]|uniref:hypothetical protein n=1 Tax=Allosalinactinospora lopnorensis TaxID=1352348 RepID=UPI000623DFBD|nr:hypothetical protein [Allosalinactinospora lopnorensis]
MDHPRIPTLPLPPRKRAAAGLSAVALAVSLGACDSGGDAGGAEADPNAAAAAELRNAQLLQFEDAKIDPDQSEQGTYARLSTTRQREELREAADLDSPECLEATTRWGKLPETREAPASLATFLREEDTIRHLLIELPEYASEEVVEAAPPEKCSSFEATMEDGTASEYAMRELELDTVGEDSRAFLVETETEGAADTVLMYTLVYRNAGYLAATTVISANEDADHEELLVDFAKTALKREERVLG